MNKAILFLFFISVCLLSIGQNSVKKAYLSDGQIPDVKLVNMRNYTSTSGKLSDFRGKLIILDFWNKGCSACIAAFPKMEHFQKLFGDKIQVLLVNPEPEPQIAHLFRNSEIVKSTKLPFIIGDSVLHGIFSIAVNPFYVFLDSNRNVLGVTTGFDITKDNIQGLLDGSIKRVGEKRDIRNFNDRESLLREGNGRQLQFLKSYSMVMGYLKGYDHGRIGFLNDSVTHEVIGRKAINMSILSLYLSAYDSDLKGFFVKGNYGTIVNSSDLNRFYPPADDSKLSEWRFANSYCYEVGFSDPVIKNGEIIMRQDLDRFFKLKSRVVDTISECYVIYRTSDKDLIKTKGGAIFSNEVTNDGMLHYINLPIGFLTGRLFRHLEGPNSVPVIDETGYTGNVDMVIKSDFANMEVLNAELSKYDLGVKRVKRPIRCVVLNDL